MGLDGRIIRVLEHARASGVDFDRTVMIGRQQVHLTESDFRAAAMQCGFADVDSLAGQLGRFELGNKAVPRILGTVPSGLSPFS